jgi:hypothetical protein
MMILAEKRKTYRVARHKNKTRIPKAGRREKGKGEIKN